MSSAPINETRHGHNNSRHSTIHLQKNTEYKANGVHAHAKAAYRYGFKNVQSGFVCADGKNGKVMRMKMPGVMDDVTEVPTSDIALDLEHCLPVYVGTPSVKLNFQVDTGSADFVCFSTPAKVEAMKNKDRKDCYDPQKSETAKLEKGLTWEMKHADGSHAKGSVHSDSCRVGECEVKHQCINVVDKISSNFIEGCGTDGILGCGFTSLNTVQPEKVKTFFSHAMDHLEKPIFTCNMKDGEPGSWTFGRIDETVTSNEMHYTKVQDKEGMWKVQTTSWKLNGETKPTSEKRCVLDTGISLVLIDDSCVNEFYQKIEGAQLHPEMGGWTFPIAAALPTVAFAIGNCSIAMDPKTLRFGEPNADGHVFGAIQSCGDLGYNVYGEALMKNCYVVFNQGTCEVGVAQKACC